MNPHFARGTGLIALAVLLPACGIGGGGTLNPAIAPAPPSEVIARPGNRSVTLTWTAPAQDAQYTLSRSLLQGGPFFPVPSGGQFSNPTTYVDEGLTNGTPYFYQVQAVNAFGESGPSQTVSATPGFRPVRVIGCPMGSFQLAILPDGSVWQWGVLDFPLELDVPLQVSGLPEVTAVSPGGNCTLALDSKGNVWAWGANNSGQLGTGAAVGIFTPVPAPVLNLSGVVAIASGVYHSVAVTSDGSVWTWGDNSNGQLGVPPSSLSSSGVPLQVAGLSDIVSVSAGMTFSLALRKDGLVFSWGQGQVGELGNGNPSPTPVPTPTLVPNLNGVIAIASGYQDSHALKSDGTLWSWGNNDSGDLGLGSTTLAISHPTQVVGLAGVVGMAEGGTHSLAVLNDGTVWSWGDNTYGEMGNGTNSLTPVTTPVQVPGLTDILSVAASSGTSFALKPDGTVWAWGSNLAGELGIGTGLVHTIPLELPNVTGVTAIGGGSDYSSAIRAEGQVWSWGLNEVSEFGNGTSSTLATATPASASNLSLATTLAAGGAHQLILKADGTVWGWGDNVFGQAGNGTTGNNVTTPSQISLLTGALALAAGGDHSLAIRSDRTLASWGWNGSGQLGFTTPGGDVTGTPTIVPGLAGVTSVAGGGLHSLAVLQDGTVWSWGSNQNHQLGYAASGSVFTPTQVPGLAGIVQVAAGSAHSLALAGDGTVWAWGAGTNGQLGTGGMVDLQTPVQVSGLSGVTALAAGESHSLAMKGDGSVWSWGDNTYGQLGNPLVGSSPVPVLVKGLPAAVQIASGRLHSMAIIQNGTMWLWGFNYNDQLGITCQRTSEVPISIPP